MLSGITALCAVAGIGLRTAHAELDRRMLVVVHDRTQGVEGCFDVDALQQRIAYYANARSLAASELVLELHVDAADSAELWVYRQRELVSRRRFENLPDSCVDRRDAVALSIALALDGLVQATNASQDQNAAPAGPAAGAGEDTGAREAQPALRPDAAATQAQPPAPVSSQAQPAQRPAAPSTRAQSTTRAVEPAVRDEDAEDEEGPQPSAAVKSDSENAEEPPETEPPGTAALALRVRPHLGGRWIAGAVPSAVWMGALGAELSLYSWLALDVSGFASSVGNSAFASAHVEARVMGGELVGCGELQLDDFAAQGCAGALLAACRATGIGYPVPAPAALLPWAAATARIALRWPRDSWISLRLLVQSHVNLVRPELHVDGAADQLAPGWLGASTGLDVIVSLN